MRGTFGWVPDDRDDWERLTAWCRSAWTVFVVFAVVLALAGLLDLLGLIT